MDIQLVICCFVTRNRLMMMMMMITELDVNRFYLSWVYQSRAVSSIATLSSHVYNCVCPVRPSSCAAHVLRGSGS